MIKHENSALSVPHFHLYPCVYLTFTPARDSPTSDLLCMKDISRPFGGLIVVSCTHQELWNERISLLD